MSTPTSRAARRAAASARVERAVDEHDRPADGADVGSPGATGRAARRATRAVSAAEQARRRSSGRDVPTVATCTADGSQVRQPAGPRPVRRVAVGSSRGGADRRLPAGAARPAGRPRLPGRRARAPAGPTTARPPPRRRSTTTGRCGAVLAAPGTVAVHADDPVGRRDRCRAGRSARPASPAVRLHSRAVRRRAAVGQCRQVGMGRLGGPESAARTASASRASAAATSRARARRASRRPLRRPVHRSDSHVPSGDDGAEQGEEQEGRRVSSHAMSTPPTAGRATATHARRRRGGGAGGRGNGDSTSTAGGIMRGRRPEPDGARPAPAPSARGGCARSGEGDGGRAQAEDRPGRPRTRLGATRSAPSRRLPLVEPRSATVIRSAADVHGDVPAGDVGIVERNGRVAAAAEHVPTLAERERAPGVRTAHDVQLQRAGPRRRGTARGSGRPSPRTAPWPSAGAVSGRSSAQPGACRPEAVDRHGRGPRASAAEHVGERCPRRAAVSSTSTRPGGADERPAPRDGAVGPRGDRSRRDRDRGRRRPGPPARPVDNGRACGQLRRSSGAARPSVRRDREGPGPEEDP